jgi:hypothetical protein
VYIIFILLLLYNCAQLGCEIFYSSLSEIFEAEISKTLMLIIAGVLFGKKKYLRDDDFITQRKNYVVRARRSFCSHLPDPSVL